MRWVLILSGVMVALQGTSIGVRADDRKDIEAVYGKLRQAILHKNPATVLTLETSDFVIRPMRSRTRMTGKQLAEQMRLGDTMVRSIKTMDIHLLDVAVRGRFASVTSTYTYAAKFVDRDGKMGPRGTAHLLTISGLNHNTLVRTPAGWKFSAQEMAPPKINVDGKPVNTSHIGPWGPAQ